MKWIIRATAIAALSAVLGCDTASDGGQPYDSSNDSATVSTEAADHVDPVEAPREDAERNNSGESEGEDRVKQDDVEHVDVKEVD